MEMMLLSFLLPGLQKDWHLEAVESGLMGAIVFLGMLLGNISLSWVGDIVGRKPVIIVSNFICAVFGVISGTFPSFYFNFAKSQI